MIAVVMCGGKGTRMDDSTITEKPLQRIRGKTSIEYVVGALMECRMFDKVVLVPSPNTPFTSKFVRNIYHSLDNVEIFESAGLDYSHDLMRLVEYLIPSKLMVLGADLPCINAKIIKKIIHICDWDFPCISVILDRKFVEGIGVEPSIMIHKDNLDYCHSGIMLIDTLGEKDKNGLFLETYILMNEKEIAININTTKDLELARALCSLD
jgi:GTP:adenosylcobinamide-phosphate guanylyltransferase